MSKTFEPNISGFIQLRNSPEVQQLLLSTANEIVGRCEGNYEVDVYQGKTRANSSIITRDSATYHRNLRDNELLNNLR